MARTATPVAARVYRAPATTVVVFLVCVALPWGNLVAALVVPANGQWCLDGGGWG